MSHKFSDRFSWYPIDRGDSLEINITFDRKSAIEMSPSVESILAGKYPAKKHCERVLEYIQAKHSSVNEGLLYLEGQKTRMNEDNDQEAPFRQRRYFYYLTGCELPDCYVTYDIKTHKSTLYIPPVNEDDVVWSGLPLSVEEALKK